MPAPTHIAVIAGATAPVLRALSPVLKQRGIIVIAREVKSGQKMLDNTYLYAIFSKTRESVQMRAEQSQDVRLSLWYYDLGEEYDWIHEIQKLFFPFSCFVKIPSKYYNRPSHTVKFASENIVLVERWMNQIYTEITSRKASSPFLLPLRNFHSDVLTPLYRELVETVRNEQIQEWLKLRRKKFRQTHSWRAPDSSSRPCFHDDRHYAFQANDPGAPHGKKWPGGNTACYLNGVLRFGACIAQGFHYDVQPPGSNVRGKFFGCDGAEQDLTGGRFTYLNIFPNDHYQPKSK